MHLGLARPTSSRGRMSPVLLVNHGAPGGPPLCAARRVRLLEVAQQHLRACDGVRGLHVLVLGQEELGGGQQVLGLIAQCYGSG